MERAYDKIVYLSISMISLVYKRKFKEVAYMITYKRCIETNEDAIYHAFQVGFSDYMIKMELPKDLFMKRFFGPEGNSLEYSVIAFDDENPIGLNLGGIKVYEGVKTLRCGALCIHPEYRGSGVSRKLFELHKEIAIENNCKQLFLEVIVGNDRAISFYKKMGYDKVYDLTYYSHSNPAEIKATFPKDLEIKKIQFDELRSLNSSIYDIHINWQNDFDYLRHFENLAHYGVFDDSGLIGGLCIHPMGKINFMWLDPAYRGKGVGSWLISQAVEELRPEKLIMNFPNNASLTGFVKRLGFSKDSLSQYEMYQPL